MDGRVDSSLTVHSSSEREQTTCQSDCSQWIKGKGGSPGGGYWDVQDVVHRIGDERLRGLNLLSLLWRR